MSKFLFFVIILCPAVALAQQVADPSFNPSIPNPAYEAGQGPVIFIDEGHFNFHTKEGRYKAFSTLLERDGYNVTSYTGEFEPDRLALGEILVISNALNELNVTDWFLPNPSAFTETEIETLEQWVNKGGNLFLIADHMPMAGAAEDLASRFGFKFTNGFVINYETQGTGYFNIEDGTLFENIITNGRNPQEKVSQIATFTGQAFDIPEDATPILTFGENFVNLLPDTAWVFNDQTPREDVDGMYQGAYKEHGKGRVVVFGEAAMFTAQLSGAQQRKVGMNNEVAPENYQLLLNIIHWLDGII
ncbi:MAG: DUF4350 domain-containing protein [Balneolaceae bacterium]|nr:DUF4350 domain-containing protein [Balneolaceae bacterium]MBO6546559.1 DUF4350 domain-containing protein [Balneolaceae bacterium]MBO6648918.1 DUF4350 domain-containing protein [Balneolaceae bacterium]